MVKLRLREHWMCQHSLNLIRTRGHSPPFETAKEKIMLPIKPQQIIEAFSPEFFWLKIFPTGNCNYSCLECYESHIDVNRENFANKASYIPLHMRRLSRAHINGIKNLLTKRKQKGLKFLCLSWFGGEPLLEPKIIEEIHDHANSLGINKILGSATTNFSALNDKMMKKYCDMGVTEFYMTLEGAKEDHDKKRVLINGKGTYDKLISNLLIAKKSSHPFTIGIRIHIYPDNLENMGKFLIYIRDVFLVDKRFSVDLRTVGDYGGESVKNLKLFESKEAEQVLANLQKYIQPIKQKKIRKKTDDPGCYICYACKPNGLIVLNTGELAKCTVSQEVVGMLLEDGRTITNKQKMLKYSQGWDDVKESGGKNTKRLTCAYAK